MFRNLIKFYLFACCLISVKLTSQPLPLNLYWAGKTDSALIVANTISAKPKAFAASYLANAYDFLAEYNLEQGHFENNKKFIRALFSLNNHTSIDSALFFARFANYYHCNMMWDSVAYFCSKAIKAYAHNLYKPQENTVNARYYSYIGNAARCTKYRNANYLDSAVLLCDNHTFLKALHYRRYATFNSDLLNIPEKEWKFKKNVVLYKNTTAILNRAEALATKIYPNKKSSLHGAIYKIWSLVVMDRGQVDESLQLVNKTKEALIDKGAVLNYADYSGISTFEATTNMNLYYKSQQLDYLYKNEKSLLDVVPIWGKFYKKENEYQINGFDDEYNLNPFQKLLAVYFELYQNTKNKIYLSKAFSLIEFIKNKRTAFDLAVLNKDYSKALDSIEKLCKLKRCSVVNYFVTHSPAIVLAIVSLPDTTFMLNCLPTPNYNPRDNINNIYEIGVIKNDDYNFKKLNYIMYRAYFSKIDTILQKRKIKKVVIISDGFLNALNFDILQTDSAKFISMTHSALFSKYKFSYAISARSVVNNNQDLIQYTHLNILAPVYNSTSYPRLIFGEKLVNTLNTLYATTNLNNISKTIIFKENQLVQFIGHVKSSYLQNEQFLILNDSTAISNYEFRNQNVSGSSYLLNGCQSGIGRNVKFDRVNNFSNVLLKQKAYSVISSVWPIDDKENAEFQEKFYFFLAVGLSSSDALQKAKHYFAQHNYPVSMWGAYIYYGNDFYLSPKKTPNTLLYLVLISFSISILILVLIKAKLKKAKSL